MKIYATNSGKSFGENLAGFFDAELNRSTIGSYNDGQIFVELQDIPHKEDVIAVGNTKGPVELNELGLLIHTLKKESIRELIVVMPYFGAGRQDHRAEEKRKKKKQDVAAKFYANIFSYACRPDWMLIADLHNRTINSFFDDDHLKVDEVEAKPLFISEIYKMGLKDFIFVSADVGRLKWARSYAEEFGVDVASIDKRRDGPGNAHACNIVGSVKDKNIILIDDMIDTGGTIIEAVEVLKNMGANDIHLFATHLLFSKDSYKKFLGNPLFSSLHGTDTIDASEITHGFKIHSMAELFADYIKKEIR